MEIRSLGPSRLVNGLEHESGAKHLAVFLGRGAGEESTFWILASPRDSQRQQKRYFCYGTLRLFCVERKYPLPTGKRSDTIHRRCEAWSNQCSGHGERVS